MQVEVACWHAVVVAKTHDNQNNGHVHIYRKENGRSCLGSEKLTKLKCQVMIDYITAASLNLFENFEIYRKSTRPDIPAILKARTNGRFISVQDKFRQEKLSATTQ